MKKIFINHREIAKYAFLVMMLLTSTIVFGQEPSAILNLESTTEGFLPPRMNTSQRDAILLPSDGMIIFNIGTGYINYYDAFLDEWLELRPPICPNPHINYPEGNQTFSQEFSTNGMGQVVITVEFSAPINFSTVVDGTTFTLSSGGSPIAGTFEWNYNHTRLVFTTNDSFGTFCSFNPDCFLTLEITGAVFSKTGCALDGDGDGTAGGSFTTTFGILG